MERLHPVDLAVLLGYLVAVAALGASFRSRSRDPRGFKIASGRLAGWAVGMSLFGTFLSSNTFLGVPGKAYASDWNAFVFSLTLPVAAYVAVRWFLPFHRAGATISAYSHFAERFGGWAQIYAAACYLLTQLARIGSILFGVSLALSQLTGWPLWAIVLALGALVTAYTVIGGIEAVIWTDVVQSVVLSAGALFALVTVLRGVPGGLLGALREGAAAGKTSLGSFSLDPAQSTFWVVLAYGLVINLTNFGIDQSYVQRYHAARSAAHAARSVWLAAWLYLPVSLVFFVLGTSLFVWGDHNPELVQTLRAEVAVERAVPESEVGAAEIGDRVFPRFIAGELPIGLRGLLLAALLAAAMSSIDTSLNSSATILQEDVLRPRAGPRSPTSDGSDHGPDAASEDVGRREMRMLHACTLAMGLLGTAAALALLRVRSILDAWWTLSGIFAGGLLGLFLLGFVVHRARSAEAALAVIVGTGVIGWLTLEPRLPETLLAAGSPLRLAVHANLITVLGTLTVFAVGLLASRLRPSRSVAG
ncbi:MAG: sodium:solute symporter [Acidobacteria bacterium]|nr:MAG: sodium:solute symporter [Acidobacteriota bacterium]REK07725.1 MAG: sodium:solute symporter [Acidobacteriota bacterium]